MSYKSLFVVNALLALIIGLVFLFVPDRVLAFLGTEGRIPELLLARFFGSAMLTVGLLLWFVKDVTDPGIQRRIGMAMFISFIVWLAVVVFGISPLNGAIRTNGWIVILVYVLFALGYGYLLFLKPKMKE